MVCVRHAMFSVDQNICVEDATKCSDDVLRYRINVKNNRVVVRRYSDFRAFNTKLDNVEKKPKLPPTGLIGFRKKYNLLSFNERRRAGLESYLRELCSGDACQQVLDKFLTDTRVELYGKTSAELEPYLTPELKAFGFNAPLLRAKGRTAKCLLDAGFSSAEVFMSHYGFTEQVAFHEHVPLKDAMKNFSKEQILHSHSFSVHDLKQQSITMQELKEHEYKIAEIIEVFGKEFSTNELRQGGITAQELKEQNFDSEKILNAGFNAEELFKAGYNFKDQVAFGKEFTVESAIRVFGVPHVLESHVFSTYALKLCGFTAKDLKKHNYKDASILRAGFSIHEFNKSDDEHAFNGGDRGASGVPPHADLL